MGHFAAIVERPFTAHPLIELQAHLGLAAAHRAAGRRAEAARWAERATAWALERGIPGALEQAEALHARLGLAAGQTAKAIAWVESRPPPRSSIPLFLIEDPVLTWIQAQLARPGGAGLAAASAVLAEELRFCEATHGTLRRIHVLALEALLLDAQGERETALDALQQAAELAEPGRIVRPFLDLRPSLAPLLRVLAARPQANGHVQRVLAAGTGAAGSTPAPPARHAPVNGKLVESLTTRELEVLALLQQRYSNDEIAAHLVVSPVTVKSHAHNIYGKLGVRGRREAVARARGLGLLGDG